MGNYCINIQIIYYLYWLILNLYIRFYPLIFGGCMILPLSWLAWDVGVKKGHSARMQLDCSTRINPVQDCVRTVAENKNSLNVIHGRHLSYLIFENNNHHQHQKGISWRFIASDTQTGCSITTYQDMAKRKTSEALHFSFSVAKLSSRSTYRHAFETPWKSYHPYHTMK